MRVPCLGCVWAQRREASAAEEWVAAQDNRAPSWRVEAQAQGA